MSTNVQTTINLTGNDQFSAVFAKLKSGAQDVSKATDKAGASTAAIGERAGNLERGFMGLKDIIGGVADGPLAAVADRMGGIEAVTQGFGAKMGMVGLAIGVVAMGATMLYERMEKARKAALDVEILRLDTLKEDGEALARHLSLSQELLGVKQGLLSVEDVQSAAMGHAKNLLENQKAILEAQKEKEEEKIALLQIEGANLRGLLGIDELRLQRAKDAADVAAGLAVRDIQNAQFREQEEARINGIMNVNDRLKERARVRQNELANLDMRIVTNVADLKKATGQKEVELENQFTELKRRRYALEAQERSDAAEGEAVANTRKAERQAAAQRSSAAYAAAEKKRMDAEREHEQWMRQNQAQRRDELIARDQDLEATQERIREADIAAAESPVARARLALKNEELKAEMERIRISVRHEDDAELWAAKGIEISKRVSASKRALAAEELKARDDASAKAKEENAARIDGAFSVANAVASGLEQMGMAEQAAAGVKALVSAAEAGLAAARGNYAGAVAGAFAAVQFGKIALGGGAPQVPGVGNNDGMGQATSTQRGTQGGQASGAVVINFNKGFYGDAASTAKGIAGTLKTIKGSGIPAWKGA